MDPYENPFITARFSSFLDLDKPSPLSPNLAWAPSLAYECDSPTQAEGHAIGLQRIVNGAFRNNLMYEARVRRGGAFNPLDVPAQLRSVRWERLCSAVERFDQLADGEKVWATRVLLYAGFTTFVTRLLAEPSSADMTGSRDRLYLGFLHGFGRSLMLQGQRDWASYDPGVLHRVIDTAPRDFRIRCQAAKALLVYYGKVRRDLPAARAALAEVTGYIRPHLDGPDETDTHVLLSGCFRSTAFVPMLERDRDGVEREMAKAEEHARAALRAAADERQRVTAVDGLHSLLESRMRQMQWLDDRDAAVEYMREVVEIDPWDAKGHLQYGEVLWRRGDITAAAREFATAALYGPPGTALSHYLAGNACERLEDDSRAADHYLASLRADPGGISAALALAGVARRLNAQPIEAWCLQRLHHSRGSGELGEAELAELDRLLAQRDPLPDARVSSDAVGAKAP